MNRVFFVVLLLVTLAANAVAQPRAEEREEKIKAYRVAVFTNTLNLTSEEAQGFWPLYNDYIEKREALQMQYRPSKQLDAMSETEVEDQLKRHFELKQKELDLERDAYQRLRNVLPLRKIVKIPSAERDFREALLQKLNEARERRLERKGKMGN